MGNFCYKNESDDEGYEYIPKNEPSLTRFPINDKIIVEIQTQYFERLFDEEIIHEDNEKIKKEETKKEEIKKEIIKEEIIKEIMKEETENDKEIYIEQIENLQYNIIITKTLSFLNEEETIKTLSLINTYFDLFVNF